MRTPAFYSEKERQAAKQRAAYLAERKRVDEYIIKKKTEMGKIKTPERKYPMAVRMLGPGFMDLYDAVGGRYTVEKAHRKSR